MIQRLARLSVRSVTHKMLGTPTLAARTVTERNCGWPELWMLQHVIYNQKRMKRSIVHY